MRTLINVKLWKCVFASHCENQEKKTRKLRKTPDVTYGTLSRQTYAVTKLAESNDKTCLEKCNDNDVMLVS